jgi:hypothetical protein
MLGIYLDTARLGAQDSVFPEHRNAMLPKSRYRARYPRQGSTEQQIREVILQAACYCGMPAGIEGFRIASKAVEDWKAEQARKGQSAEADLDVGQRSALET